MVKFAVEVNSMYPPPPRWQLLVSIDPEMQRFGTSATVVDAFGAGDNVISVPFGHCDSGQPAKIFQWSGSDVVLKRLLRSRYAWLRMATKLLPQVEKGNICSSTWSQATRSNGLLVHAAPPKTAMGLS